MCIWALVLIRVLGLGIKQKRDTVVRGFVLLMLGHHGRPAKLCSLPHSSMGH